MPLTICSSFGSSVVKNPPAKCKRVGFDPWVRKIPWRRKWQPTPVFLPGKSHGQRSLVGYSPWGHKRVGHNWATKQQWFKWVFQHVATLSWAAWFCKQACLIHSAFSSQQIPVEVPSWRPQTIVLYWGILWSLWCSGLRFNCHCCSLAKSCPTLRNPMDCSMLGFPVLHYLPEFAQTHVHWVSGAIQPSYPLLPLSSFALSLSQYQGPFQWVRSLHQVTKVLEFQLQH